MMEPFMDINILLCHRAFTSICINYVLNKSQYLQVIYILSICAVHTL